MTDRPTRVVVVDDHHLIRSGLTQLLGGADDIEVVGEAADGAEALDVVRRLRPDIVLMDLQMPGVDGVEATRAIVAEGLSDVLILTSFSDNERIVGALDAGALGYLLKDADPDDVIDGVRQVRRGGSPLHPTAARALLGTRSSPAGPAGPTGPTAPTGSSAPLSSLTSRESQVLGLVAEGLANKQIARRLDISERTVKAHLTSAFARIGVADRTQAALWVERQGLRRT